MNEVRSEQVRESEATGFGFTNFDKAVIGGVGCALGAFHTVNGFANIFEPSQSGNTAYIGFAPIAIFSGYYFAEHIANEIIERRQASTMEGFNPQTPPENIVPGFLIA